MTKKTRHPASKPSKPKPKASKPAAPAAPRDRLRALAPWLGAVLSGVLIFLSFPGFDLQYPIWIALVPLLLASADATPRRAFALGMVTGWLANVVGFFWMEHMLVSFGPPWMAGPVAWIIVALGAVWQALPYGGALALARIAGARGHVWAAVCFLAAFTGLEAFHPILFPWFLGDSQHGIPLPIQIADLVGVYGVTFLVVAVNLALWTLAERFVRRRPVPLGPAWAGAALLAVSLGYGALRIAQVDGAAADLERLRIGVVEPEIPIFQEQRSLYAAGTSPVRILHHNIQRLHRATLDLVDQGVDLVLWPESAWFPVLSVAARDAPFEHLALADGQIHARDAGPWTWVEALSGTRWTALSGGREDRLMAGGERGVVARWRVVGAAAGARAVGPRSPRSMRSATRRPSGPARSSRRAGTSRGPRTARSGSTAARAGARWTRTRPSPRRSSAGSSAATSPRRGTAGRCGWTRREAIA